MRAAPPARRSTRQRSTPPGKAATGDVVRKQIAAGIDVGNNGEQQREAFFLYVRHRMSGFGGGWNRKPMADIAALSRVPRLEQARANRPLGQQPCRRAEGDRRGALSRSRAVAGGMRRIPRRAGRDRRPGFAEPFMTAPSPGIIAAAMRTPSTTRGRLSRGAGRGAAGGIRDDRAAAASCCRSTRRTWRWSGTSRSRTGRCRTSWVSSSGWWHDQPALRDIPRERVRLHVVLGQLRGAARLRRGAGGDPAGDPAGAGGRLRAAVRQSAPCARDIAALANLPLDDGQVVVAGVIDPLTNFVEHPEVVADRIERRRRRSVGDPTRVLAGTDCGFDTSAGRGRVAEDVVWAKLAAMAEGARIASRRLGMG